MHKATSIVGVLVLALLASIVAAHAFDDAKYPDLSGQWRSVRPPGVTGQAAFDPTKPWGRGQRAPLTPEYQIVLEASLAEQASGGQGNWPSGTRCLPAGMPAAMTVYGEMEIVVLPEITHVLLNHNTEIHRRIYTDGRDWPHNIEPTFQGYSIGKWIDADGDGRFDVLEVETRDFKGPRALDPAGLPVHADNQSIVKERFFFDKADPKLLHDEITLIDHAFTRPWTVLKTYRRSPAKFPKWTEQNCPAISANMLIRDELYYLSAERDLMPTRKDQPPPDLRYFQKRK
ncbi:MAG TPA: hypothetical protein VH684_06850 [Xanthobacteraceae bacterium]|jgi:hypothetical protein